VSAKERHSPDAGIGPSQLLLDFFGVFAVVFDDDILDLGKFGLVDRDGLPCQSDDAGDLRHTDCLTDYLAGHEACCAGYDELHRNDSVPADVVELEELEVRRWMRRWMVR
jgi:hypothetical protein